MYIVQVFSQVQMLPRSLAIRLCMAWVRRDAKCMGFQVHIQLLCFILNYFCKNLVIVSPKLKSYKEAIVAFWKKLSVSIFVT